METIQPTDGRVVIENGEYLEAKGSEEFLKRDKCLKI